MTGARLNSSIVRALREQMRGPVLTADDAGYDDARRVWNGRFDRHPAAIARCSDVSDVQAALGIARRHDLTVAVRSGGHDYAGHSVCDGGLVIDLSQMKGLDIDPAGAAVRTQSRS